MGFFEGIFLLVVVGSCNEEQPALMRVVLLHRLNEAHILQFLHNFQKVSFTAGRPDVVIP